MRRKRLIILAAIVAAFGLTGASAYAQRGRGGASGHAAAPSAGHAVARPTGPAGRSGRPAYPYRGYYGRSYGGWYAPAWPYGYFGFGFGYGYYPYWSYWAYPYYGYPYYAPWSGYAYGGASGAGYGSVKLDIPQKGAAVYVDGQYVGIVDDFDGAFRELTLRPGPHHIEVQTPGAPQSFDVNVLPGRTVRYHGAP